MLHICQWHGVRLGALHSQDAAPLKGQPWSKAINAVSHVEMEGMGQIQCQEPDPFGVIWIHHPPYWFWTLFTLLYRQEWEQFRITCSRVCPCLCSLSSSMCVYVYSEASPTGSKALTPRRCTHRVATLVTYAFFWSLFWVNTYHRQLLGRFQI